MSEKPKEKRREPNYLLYAAIALAAIVVIALLVYIFLEATGPQIGNIFSSVTTNLE